MIKVNNLSKSYGEIKAVQNISFRVKEGEIYAFLGENGAGKSTTINILCAILKKDKGDVFIGGNKLDAEDEKIKKILGVVFQGSFLDEALSVYENLAVRAALYGFKKADIKKKIQEVADRLELNEFIGRKYKSLSGGQKRRVDIARAILHSPKLLILDEPTTGLDPATRAKVWRTIKDLRKETGMTVFFSTHYMEETEHADRISIIKKGRIAVTDTPYMLKQKYSYDTLNLYGDNEKIIEYLKEKGVKHKIKNDYIAVKIKESLESVDIVNDIRESLKSYEVRKGNMDTVFLTVTGKEDFDKEENKNE
ncbi:MAG: ABC transporter ATP-binding protein [Christensenellales bacterium]|jgi:ABC-type multidrug transport system ATPase subunit|nr:ABC transporter ATP-binding protein [Clostridiales bacterium]